jgi:DNA polymerase
VLDPFRQLLDATIDHLQHLKAQGTRFVSVSPETLRAFAATAARVGPPTASSHRREEADTPQRALTPPPHVGGYEGAELGSPAKVETAPIQQPPLSPAAKAQAIAELRERALVCVKCAHLAASRRNVVFGVGDINAQLMFVGEAPGMDEDQQGEPFVGAAGQLLTKIIVAMGLTRETVYIANILKCRPDTPGQFSGNRKPTPEEMKTCLPYLHGQIDLIQPKVLVALGATAVEGLLGTNAGITRLRGQWQRYRDVPLMPTFHPSFLLRPENASKKRLVWEDMMQVMTRLGLPISDKQRNYFLKG